MENVSKGTAMLNTEPLVQTLAYLDPGTGSMILQLLIAGLVGAGFAVKMFWFNIKGFFTRLFAGKDTASGDAVATEETTGDKDVQDQ